jgi:hypothetical protein
LAWVGAEECWKYNMTLQIAKKQDSFIEFRCPTNWNKITFKDIFLFLIPWKFYPGGICSESNWNILQSLALVFNP